MTPRHAEVMGWRCWKIISWSSVGRLAYGYFPATELEIKNITKDEYFCSLLASAWLDAVFFFLGLSFFGLFFTRCSSVVKYLDLEEKLVVVSLLDSALDEVWFSLVKPIISRLPKLTRFPGCLSSVVSWSSLILFLVEMTSLLPVFARFIGWLVVSSSS